MQTDTASVVCRQDFGPPLSLSLSLSLSLTLSRPGIVTRAVEPLFSLSLPLSHQLLFPPLSAALVPSPPSNLVLLRLAPHIFNWKPGSTGKSISVRACACACGCVCGGRTSNVILGHDGKA